MGAGAATSSVRTARALFRGPLAATAQALTGRRPLRSVVDPDGADGRAERRHERRGLWLTPTFEGMVAVNGLLEPEAGHTLLAALEPPARPAGADGRRSGGQRHADALLELARRALEGGQLPQTGGVRAQLTVTVDLDTLIGRNSLGAEPGWAGPLEPEACRRLACDEGPDPVLVTRDRAGHPHRDLRPGEQERPATPAPGGEGLGARLRAAVAKLPPGAG